MPKLSALAKAVLWLWESHQRDRAGFGAETAPENFQLSDDETARRIRAMPEWEAVKDKDLARACKMALLMLRRPRCGRCDSRDVKCLGSGTRTHTDIGTVSKLRYMCTECAHKWQIMPPGSEDALRLAAPSTARAPTAPTFTCPDCGEHFRKYGSMIRHVERRHSASGAFPCAHCNLMFPVKHNRDDHQRFCVRDGSRIVCSDCGSIFTSRKHWNIHKRSTNHSHYERRLLYDAGAGVGESRGSQPEDDAADDDDVSAEVEPIYVGEPMPRHTASVVCAVSLLPYTHVMEESEPAAADDGRNSSALLLPTPGGVLDVSMSELEKEFLFP